MMERQSKTTLRFVSVLFRHGDRTPIGMEIKFLSIDKSAYNNFYPIGVGGLTNEGKRNMYKLGTELRKRYANYLEDTYVPEHVEARTTDTGRSKVSLDLVLAGLYPPTESQTWNKDLKWQPIPTISVPSKDDVLLMPVLACPQYLKETERVVSLPEVLNKVEPFRGLAKKLSSLVGKPIINMLDMWIIYCALKSFESSALKFAEWANDILSDGLLRDGVCLQYQIFNHTELQRKLSGGILLKKMIDDMRAKINSDTAVSTRKINLYSGHELNIAALLTTLGLFEPHTPEYSSAVIVELIQRDEIYYVKVIRYLGIPAGFEEQDIGNYGTLCPFDKFVDLMKNVTPSDEEIERPPNSGVDLETVARRLRCEQFK